MAIPNQGVADRADIPIGQCNVLNFVTAAGVETVMGSIKNATLTVTQERYLHPDNSKFSHIVGDFLVGVTGEGSFDLEEWNAANLGIISGGVADADGGFLFGDKDGSEGRLEFLVDDINTGESYAVIVFKAKIYSEISLSMAGKTNIPIPVKFTVLEDTDNEYGAGEYATGELIPLVRIKQDADSGDAYGIT